MLKVDTIEMRLFSKKKKKQGTDLKNPEQIAVQRGLNFALKRHGVASVLLATSCIFCCMSIIIFFSSMQLIPVKKTLKIQGSLRAIEHAMPVTHQVGGTIQSLFVTEGEVVREGQIIASLDTRDIQDELRAARKDVALLLIRAQCLNALKEEKTALIVNDDLKQVIGKLQQVREMKRQTSNCTTELRQREFDRSLQKQELQASKEIAQFSARRAQTAIMMHNRLGQLSELEGTSIEDELSDLAKLGDILKFSKEAQEDKLNFEKLNIQIQKERLRYQEDIEGELRILSDRLVFARSELTRMETLLSEKFVYAMASGRVQSVRVEGAGAKVLAMEHIMEISPLDTDFEIVADTSTLELVDTEEGQSVRIKLEVSNEKSVWVPGKIDRILDITQNQKQVLVFIDREDLNKRDLLIGDRNLNGLGENASAVI